MESNQGFESDVVLDFKERCARSGQAFLLHPEEERTPEYVHIYFVGSHEGHEVIYDAVMYTLRLHHESEIFEIAEEKVAIKFPQYRKLTEQEEETIDQLSEVDFDNDREQEEIGLYIAEVVMELEDDEAVKVREHVNVNPEADFGIGLDVGLHLQEITDETINRFVQSFNSGALKLDPTMYSFLHSESGDE
jgi:hypothetical protein